MTAFIRLQDGDGTDIERLLLESGAEDVPSSGARARTLMALGAAGAALAASGATTSGAATAVAGTGSAKTVGSMTTLILGKWLGTGALLGAVTAACIATATTPGWLGTDPAPRVNGTGTAVPGAPRAVAPSATQRTIPNRDFGPAPSMPVEPPREEHAPNLPPSVAMGRSLVASDGVPMGGGSASAMPRAVAPSGSGNSVLAEVASLDRARSALASGDARTAVDRLTEHERAFAGGALEPEAVVLKVRALLQLGRFADATAAANRFLATHPDSSQGARLRALVGVAPR
jgi:hypothetical protein